MKQTLSLRYTGNARHEVRAWFLAGDCIKQWVDALLAWGVPHEGIAVRIVPHSIRDRSPLGILVTANPAPSHVSPRWRPYGCLVDRLFLPVEARLFPETSESELRDLLSSTMQYVWHPEAQLVAFELAEVLSLSDLLQVPEVAVSDWSQAAPGLVVQQRLVSLKAERPPSVAVFLEEGRDDIGTQADTVDELPPSPGESKTAGVFRKLGSPRQSFARMVAWVSTRMPHRPPRSASARPNWAERMKQWAGSVIDADLLRAQQRSLQRLLDLLQDDPDEGLKYALPMVNEGDAGQAGRGVAEPNARLIPRSIDFSLDRPSGAASAWYVSPETHFQLTARYQELAARELTLGRHRRAAYIYAVLLSDFGKAAAVLRSGGYYREAAELYRDRLHLPTSAAACLVAGGLLEEAIVLYEQIGDFEAAGSLYRQLDCPEQAHAAFELAAETHRKEGRLRKAATLFERELAAPGQAVEVLRSGWPGAADARQCLTEEFQLLARLGRHEEVAVRIRKLYRQPVSDARWFDLVSVLSENAVSYPDTRVRGEAADTTRLIAACELKQRDHDNVNRKRHLLNALQSLVPQDRLLKGDCHRYWRDSRNAALAASRADGEPRPIAGRLSEDVRWECAAVMDGAFCAAGYSDKELVLQMVRWRSPHITSELRWKTGNEHGGRILLSADRSGTRPIWIQILGSTVPQMKMRVWPSHDGAQAIQAGVPPWTTRDVVAFAHREHAFGWAVTLGSWPTITSFFDDGTPGLAQQLLTEAATVTDVFGMSGGERTPPGEWPVPILAHDECCYFAIGRTLVIAGRQSGLREFQMENDITGLTAFGQPSSPTIALTFPQGGQVFWPESGRLSPFGSALVSPKATFTETGDLVAVDGQRIEMYKLMSSFPRLRSTMVSPGRPIAVLPVGLAKVLILHADGRWRVFQTV